MSSPETAGTPRTHHWGNWLTQQLDQRGMTPADFQKALITFAGPGKYSSGTISSWRSGSKAPSEGACLFIARALHLPVAEVLRNAGFEDAAAVLEAEPTPDDPRIKRIRGAELTLEQSAALEEFYRARIADLDDLIDARIARILGRSETVEVGDEDAGAS